MNNQKLNLFNQFQVPDACAASPCINEGSCQDSCMEGTGYKCVCIEGRMGDKCQNWTSKYQKKKNPPSFFHGPFWCKESKSADFFRIPFNLRYFVVCETEIPQVAYAPPVKNIPERNIMKGLFHTKGRFFQPFWYPLGLTNPAVVYTTSLKKNRGASSYSLSLVIGVPPIPIRKLCKDTRSYDFSTVLTKKSVVLKLKVFDFLINL